MLYFSTRDPGRNPRSFSDIVLEGLAPDGGLYVPERIPPLDMPTLQQWSGKTYNEIATELLHLYAPELEAEMDCSFSRLMADSTRNFRSPEVAPLQQLDDSLIYTGELFHGPTYSFKDIALQFLGQVFERLLQKQGRKLTLLGATSGDTGGAAIYGVRGMNNIQLTILHPHNAISEVQRKQMCSVRDNNICNIAVKGNFDQCQSMVKEIMGRGGNEPGIPQLGAINSINWGRILAQMTYYFTLYFSVIARRSDIRQGDPVRFVVPTGNFGNVLAGYFAKRMGLPIQLVVATNRNDILHRFIAHNSYQAGDRVEPSFAPAMDIVHPSNFERYLWFLFDGDDSMLSHFVRPAKEGKRQQLNKEQHARLVADFQSHCADDTDILQAISDCYAKYSYILDPHAACAYHASIRLPQDMPAICLVTAHPAKFPEVFQALRQSKTTALRPEPEHPAGLDFSAAEEHYSVIEHDTETLLQYLQQNVWS
ncbi:threonine synthase [Candidatus Haliotispira prima]|uniref:Threonine synthase n=1 Tax=Candidatus Haliotispira prima TaxID=3034016 RepID=A0ABY8MFX5_9SPIO|nr:threonine synthase [Candidatus Haliotispira prima]